VKGNGGDEGWARIWGAALQTKTFSFIGTNPAAGDSNKSGIAIAEMRESAEREASPR